MGEKTSTGKEKVWKEESQKLNPAGSKLKI